MDWNLERFVQVANRHLAKLLKVRTNFTALGHSKGNLNYFLSLRSIDRLFS